MAQSFVHVKYGSHIYPSPCIILKFKCYPNWVIDKPKSSHCNVHTYSINNRYIDDT